MDSPAWLVQAVRQNSSHNCKLQFCHRCHFLSCNNNFMKICVHVWLFGCVRTQILNLRAKIFFANMLKIVGKSQKNGSNLIFGKFLTYLLSNLISRSLHTQIMCTKIFIKILLQDKKLQWWQNCNFAISCKFLSRLGKSTHIYVYGCVTTFQRDFKTCPC